MKIGDLVRMKSIKILPSQSPLEKISNEPGLVIEVAENACKVIFAGLDGNIRSFLKSSLEVIREQ